jgi:hypothetical protein
MSLDSSSAGTPQEWTLASTVAHTSTHAHARSALGRAIPEGVSYYGTITVTHCVPSTNFDFAAQSYTAKFL